MSYLPQICLCESFDLDKMNFQFFQSVAKFVLLDGRTTWIRMKHLE